MLCKIGVLKNFAKFTGKHLSQSLFFNKVAGWHTCFPVNFAKFLRTHFLTEHLWSLLLKLPKTSRHLEQSLTSYPRKVPKAMQTLTNRLTLRNFYQMYFKYLFVFLKKFNTFLYCHIEPIRGVL